jgi:hypothetical protein
MNGHKPPTEYIPCGRLLGAVKGSIIKMAKFLAKILRSHPGIDMLKAKLSLIPSGKWLKPLAVLIQENLKWTIRTQETLRPEVPKKP